MPLADEKKVVFLQPKHRKNRNNMKKFFFVVLALAACSGNKNARQEETIRVVTETASPAVENASTPYVGVIEEEQSTMVSFTGMAVMKSLRVSEGQYVKKGQLLATIDDAQARSSLAAAKSALEQAVDAEARMKKLHDAQSLPDMKWVEVQSKVQQARATVEICQKAVDDCSLVAPCSGVVGSKILGVGETVLPSEPVLTILSIGRVKVRVSVPETEIARIEPQTASRITIDALQGETFSGGIIEKGVAADALTHTYNVRILLDNPQQKLLPGMVAKVALYTEGSTPEITAPVKAVQQTASGQLFVWVAKGGKALRQNVRLGETRGNRIVLAEGVNEGDEIIVEGYQKVSEGTPIATR